MDLKASRAHHWARGDNFLHPFILLFVYDVVGDEGMDGFEAPEAQRWVSGLWMKLAETDAEAALGAPTGKAYSFISSYPWYLCVPISQGAP